MDRQKLLLIFGGAFLAAALLTWFLYAQTVAPKKDRMVTVWAAAADLPAGTRLQKVHLKKIAVPQATAPRGAVAEESLALDRALLFPILQNEPILSVRLSSVSGADGVASLIEPGKRGVSVSVADAASAGGLIQPRAHVDVLFTRTGSMAEAVTTTVLEDVVVLSIGRSVEAQSAASAPGTSVAAPAPASTGNRSVTLLVTPDEARVLELAKNQGRISLSLRNPKDTVKNDAVQSATFEAIDPGLPLRTAKARALASGRMPSRALLNIPNLKDDKAWAALVGEEPEEGRPQAFPRTVVEKRDPPRPRVVIDVFRGDKHVQETFQD
ncbi:MAG TPA: Flp pilus assembly protein CpaB [Bryobacteraceae bacterium]|nr:Flp pilus assembly protein CpaB [Bryobacteraceae bacterium]